jgi:hypothetical protein
MRNAKADTPNELSSFPIHGAEEDIEKKLKAKNAMRNEWRIFSITSGLGVHFHYKDKKHFSLSKFFSKNIFNFVKISISIP